MKNKKLIYILAPLALIVWGSIFYRIITGMEDNAPGVPAYMNTHFGQDKSTSTDSITLIANYRDPFLSGSIQKLKPVVTTASLENRRSLSQNQKAVAPDVKYFGLVSNTKSKNKVGLIKIQGNSVLLKEGETAGNQIKIVKLFKDSMVLIHQNSMHIIKRI